MAGLTGEVQVTEVVVGVAGLSGEARVTEVAGLTRVAQVAGLGRSVRLSAPAPPLPRPGNAGRARRAT
ncbi:hypothetical protein [Streptomyces sp. NPDC006309]|uniref:hypothetical protein n=1 Tax=Streptomyces sp. NPDC006309 TaxID=3156749 RepID=UPI0033AA8201